ncbi:hypothetical protein AXG93_3612s1150 [Marchantia polymorpha subsp. ruderalis]|uniref:Uncharacterized protein n=1 Tax=Marchantia polymorpha subsp. ruderalis TaxID=1480154 RepID=A0A176WDE3_MARPO|nr:hypothetical protein AXG93_3612s1150 [Marchantia polymorpha subsp. ruderalis]
MAELRQSGQRKPRTQQAETSQPNRQDRRRRRYGPRRFPYQQPQPSTDADGCITVQRKNRWTPRIKHGLVATTNAGTTAPDVPTVDLDVVMTEATTVDSIPHLEGVVQEPQAHQAQATHPTRIRTRLGASSKHSLSTIESDGDPPSESLQLNTPATAEPPSYDIWGFRRVTTKSVGAAAAPSDEEHKLRGPALQQTGRRLWQQTTCYSIEATVGYGDATDDLGA